MPKYKPQDYHSVADYVEATEIMCHVNVMILFAFARDERKLKDVIIRNFVARTTQSLKGIMRLWEIEDFQGCYILYRCMLDRLFLLSELQHKDEFELFDNWSFVKQCEYQNRARSEIGASEAKNMTGFSRTDEESARLGELMRDPPKWSRPKAKDVAKRMKLSPLYAFGYDHASMNVHPMANDGVQDFYTLTKLEPATDFPDTPTVLHNSLHVSLVLVQTGVKASSFSVRSLLNDFLEDMMRFLESGSADYKRSYAKLVVLFRDSVNLCEVVPGE